MLKIQRYRILASVDYPAVDEEPRADGEHCRFEDVERLIQEFKAVLDNVTDATPLQDDAAHQARLVRLGLE